MGQSTGKSGLCWYFFNLNEIIIVKKYNISSFLIAKMFENNFYQQLLARVFQIIGIVLSTEQSIKSLAFIFQGFRLNFKSTFTVFREFMNDFLFKTTLGEHLTITASTNMFYIAIDYKNKLNMKIAASNINIKIYQLFSKQLILGVRVTIVPRKI